MDVAIALTPIGIALVFIAWAKLSKPSAGELSSGDLLGKPARHEMCQDCWSWKRVGRQCRECGWNG